MNGTAEVTRRHVEEKIVLKVSGVPPLNVTESWQRHTRRIEPDRVVLILIDGKRSNITVRGPQLLKSGRKSETMCGSLSYSSTGSSGLFRSVDEAPAWVRAIWQHAPEGVAEFAW